MDQRTNTSGFLLSVGGSKYYPPDFNPPGPLRSHRPRNQQIKVRLILPMTVRCNTCASFIHKGTKFNASREDVIGETYLGIQIYRFYFKCTKCRAKLTMKTDPQNSDYIVESGGTRITASIDAMIGALQITDDVTM